MFEIVVANNYPSLKQLFETSIGLGIAKDLIRRCFRCCTVPLADEVLEELVAGHALVAGLAIHLRGDGVPALFLLVCHREV